MKEEFVQQLVNNAARAIKNNKFRTLDSAFSPKRDFDSMVSNLPAFNPIYADSVLHHYRIAVHNELDVFPYMILKAKAPNQSPDEWDYQRGLYKSYSNSTWERAKNKTKIVANDQNYSISGWDEEQKDYFYTDYPHYHSLVSYMFEIVRDRKINYPNQVLLVKPAFIPGDYNEDGEFIIDDTQEISPIVTIIDEEKVVQCTDDYLLIITQTSCHYKSGDHDYYDGLAFEFYDENTIWEIRQTGWDAQHSPVFDYRIIYEHNWGVLPAKKLGGKPVKVEDGNMLFHSHFISAVPDLESVIQLSSNLDMSLFKLGFPIIIAVVDKCSYKDHASGEPCRNGKVFISTEPITCPSCHGSGKANNHSPTGVYEIAATVGNNQENNLPMTPPVQFAAPSSDILTHLASLIKDKKQSAFSNLFDTDPAKSNTATGAALEKEEWYSFITQFSNELFSLMEFAIEGIGFMRWGDAFVKPTIRKPTSFNVRDISQITVEIGDANKNNMTASYKQALNKEAVSLRFGTSETEEKKNNLIYRIDRLWDKTTLEVRGMVNVTCTKLDAIIHDSINTFIDNAAADNEGFWGMEFSQQKQIIIELANAELIKLAPEPGSSLSEQVTAAV
jgi:hypothetical protein